MHTLKLRLLAVAAATPFLLVACATAPMGPTVQVMPSNSKPFQVFQQDQEMCKQYANSQVAGQADVANQKAVGSALLGTALGATFGAAVGNRQGAGIFGSTGAIAGTAAGTASAGAAQLSIQEQYNNSYTQCMYSRGNQVPGAVAEQQSPPPVANNAPSAQNAAYAPPSAASSYPRVADMQAAPMTTRRAQVLLNNAGYPVGEPDGVFGLRSRQQLKKYQADNGLPATGELDPQTVAALNR